MEGPEGWGTSRRYVMYTHPSNASRTRFKSGSASCAHVVMSRPRMTVARSWRSEGVSPISRARQWAFARRERRGWGLVDAGVPLDGGEVLAGDEVNERAPVRVDGGLYGGVDDVLGAAAYL